MTLEFYATMKKHTLSKMQPQIDDYIQFDVLTRLIRYFFSSYL